MLGLAPWKRLWASKTNCDGAGRNSGLLVTSDAQRGWSRLILEPRMQQRQRGKPHRRRHRRRQRPHQLQPLRHLMPLPLRQTTTMHQGRAMVVLRQACHKKGHPAALGHHHHAAAMGS